MIRLSYIIPCYNCSAFIADTLNSIIENVNLSNDEYEIICVNDCSTDDTSQTIKEFAQRHLQVRLIEHTENLRQGGGRNSGMEAANGTYIAFADHDDRLPMFDLKSLLDEMDEQELDILMCDVNFQQPDLSLTQTSGLHRTVNTPICGAKVFKCDYMIKGGMLGVWSSLYRKDYALTLPTFAEHVRVEDADWLMRAIGYARRLEYKPIAIYNWMYYEDSQSHGLSAEMRADLVQRGLREIDVAHELRVISEKAYSYCYDDGLQSIKTATNALWKRYNTMYRHRFMNQLSTQETEHIAALNVNKRCNFLFAHPSVALTSTC